MAGRVAVFLTHADGGAIRLAGACAIAAVAMGDRVDVFVLGAAVRALASADEADHPAALLLRARAAGCRVLACSASVVEEKVDPADAEAAFDAIVGWPTVLEWTRGVADRFFF